MEPNIDHTIYVWHKSSNTEDFMSLVKDHKSDILSVLYQHGAILFKGFNIDNEKKLEASLNSFGGSSLNYIDGNSPRTKISDRVYTSTEYPAEAYIYLHNELSYCLRIPTKLNTHSGGSRTPFPPQALPNDFLT